MRSLKNRSIGFYLCFGLLLAMAMVGSAIVYADSGTGTAKVIVKAGNLTPSNVTDQKSLNVNKKVKLITYTLPITVTDARGSGAGWNLTISSTTFSTNDKDKDKLPANASSITGMSVSCAAHSTCTNPVNSISYPLGVPAGDTPPPPVKFFNAAVSSGLGDFLLTMMVQVNIPTNVKPGTYTSTIFLYVVSGP